EQALEHYRKFNSCTGIRGAELLLYRDIENAPQYTELLVNGCRLQGAELDDSIFAANASALLQPAAQMEFDLRGVDLVQLHRAECRSQGFKRRLVALVGLGRSDGRLGIMLQEQIRPVVETPYAGLCEGCPTCCCLWLAGFAELPLRLLPV